MWLQVVNLLLLSLALRLASNQNTEFNLVTLVLEWLYSTNSHVLSQVCDRIRGALACIATIFAFVSFGLVDRDVYLVAVGV